MAYHGPVRLSLKGDRAVAARFVRVGRVLLWKMERTNAGASSRRTIKLPGDVIIEAVIAGRLRLLTITAPEGGGETAAIIEHFVTWPRTEALPDGIDEDHPQLMHRVEDDAWRTLFYDPGIDGCDEFERLKGAYRTEGGVPIFPDGVRHAGNLDWRGKDGVRVSWYGPSSRYFLDPYVQPTSQYGKKVFMLGQVLYDAEQYMADSDETFVEQYVMGAALSPDRRWLYTVQAELPYGITLSGTAPARLIAVFPPYPTTDPYEPDSPIPIAVCRYRVLDAPENVLGFSIAPESRVVLHGGVYQRALHPWFFNERADTAVSIAFPELLTSILTTAMGTVYTPPSETNTALTYHNGAITMREVTAAPGAPGMVAADFKGNTLVELTALRESTATPSPFAGRIDAFRFAIGGASWDAYSVTYTNPPALAQQIVHHRALLWADLRAGTAVFAHLQIQGTVPSAATVLFEIELWHGASRVQVAPIDWGSMPGIGVPRRIADASADGTRAMNMNADHPVAPLFLMYGSHIFFGGIQSIMTFPGRVGTLWTTPFPQEDMFGQYAFNGVSPAPYYLIESTANFSSNLTDFDGHLSVLGAASYEGASMLSCYDFGTQDGAAFNLMHGPEAGVTLPVVTGVSGPKQRYHPIWLLGALPRTEV